MHLGVDLGTTRTIVAATDRGNYPVVSFLDGDGDAHDHFPSVVADDAGDLVYGFDAVAAGHTGAAMLRSFKRILAAPDVTGATPVAIGSRTEPILDVLTGFLTALRGALYERSNLPRSARNARAREGSRTVVGVPAHAHGAQRYLTLEAFRRAGFTVTAMVNEPSAAGFEYTHRRGTTVSSRRTRVVVYDLGGGTFDASLVDVRDTDHDVLATAGLNRLGGDDFDEVLVDCALAAAGASDTQDPALLENLRDQAREAKERLTPQSRRIALDVGDTEVTVGVDAYYEAVTPLLQRTIDAMRPLLATLPDESGEPAESDQESAEDLTEIAGIYLVGGGSGLPLVPRLLREQYGRRVHRSPLPAASTAIGLAIAADPDADFTLTDRLSRGFGVFRERDGGAGLSFDAILRPDATLPADADEDTVIVRRYRAAHNVGRFRYVECTAIDDSGEPRGNIVPFAQVTFPFDPALQSPDRGAAATAAEVHRRDDGPLVEERYLIDRNGMIEVRITDLDSGYSQTHAIGARD
ncbi:Hsp70 family protein [Occultella glacieicola]|uniref:Hsp70 family protein n=1 Tax=Occultella glacieicola TaxID=2518684 RepID=A0ABY2E7M1_9MICO|nr:Hsp70 family protein [Occultella glacieicola]TDE97558.1 Hsp70 family protein [Occultella glacieicola]